MATKCNSTKKNLCNRKEIKNVFLWLVLWRNPDWPLRVSHTQPHARRARRSLSYDKGFAAVHLPPCALSICLPGILLHHRSWK
ncbi:Ribosomal L1 domain-containing protein 1 [Manis javanica]|nr:Ribosomal L1 domain-containing protein 1 [Manis javanica]